VVSTQIRRFVGSNVPAPARLTASVRPWSSEVGDVSRWLSNDKMSAGNWTSVLVADGVNRCRVPSRSTIVTAGATAASLTDGTISAVPVLNPARSPASVTLSDQPCPSPPEPIGSVVGAWLL